MLSAIELEHSIREAIPAAAPADVAALAQFLVESAATAGSPGKEAHPSIPAHLQNLLGVLAGARLQAGQSVISFGSDSQIGDITIGTVAGGDVITLHLTLSGPLRQQSVVVEQSGSIGQLYQIEQQTLHIYLSSASTPQPPSQASTESPTPRRLESPEGTMPPNSPFYIKRQPGDRIAENLVARSCKTLSIKGPRQVGKSSLLTRIVDRAEHAGQQVVYLDFQQIDDDIRADNAQFYRHICRWVCAELELPDEVGAIWASGLGNVQCCTRYIERQVLKVLNRPLLLALDEVDSILESPFRNEFFAMLRSWHNNRANRPIWKQFSMALVTSTEPYQLVDNLHQSPFNVGEVVDLADFDLDQVAELNRRHSTPLAMKEVEELMTLVGGHPYLVRRALYLIADNRLSFVELCNLAVHEHGPFGEHLRRHLQRLHEREELVQVLRQALWTGVISDDRLFWRLRGAGLIRREEGRVVMRCQVYDRFFRERLL